MTEFKMYLCSSSQTRERNQFGNTWGL